MTGIIGSLRDSRDSYSEKLRQLLIQHKNNPDALFCVYEGEDAKYYGIRIDNITRFTDRRRIPCRGKADVLRLHEKVNSDSILRASNTIFFVDHDFDGMRGMAESGAIYMTPCYSVENLYIDKLVVRKILTEEFLLDDFDNSEELENIIELYEQRLAELVASLTPLNAWIAIQREKEDASSKLNLGSTKLNKFVTISLEKVDSKYTIDSLDAMFPDAIEVSEGELQTKILEFDGGNKVLLFRGKYLIEFLRVFLDLLKEDKRNSIPNYFSSKSNVKLVLSKNILSELSQYAITPDCLKEFLNIRTYRT